MRRKVDHAICVLERGAENIAVTDVAAGLENANARIA
jgi:hypothetical protein